MHDDAQLLRQYTESGSEPAFRELVERHIQLVNSTARRMVNGDAHLAQDVTQLVFTDLARKAATLPNDVVLGGWLHRHTCYTALKAIRTESRRRTRERTAMELNAVNDSPGADAYWAQLAPVLDDALNRLDAPDRDAIVLRFLQQQDLRSIGRTLGLSEDTAQKRVTRALDKLRGLLTNRGVAVSSATLLATSLEAASVAPVTPGLAAIVSAHALNTATAAGTGLTLISLKTMITSKLALGMAATVAVVGATYVFVNPSSPSPASSAAPQTISSTVSSPQTPLQASNKVVAPKLAPAPAGNKPATPDDLAASAVSPAVNFTAMQGAVLRAARPGANSNINLTSDIGVQHSASVTGDGVNVTYIIDGVAQTVPAGTPMTVTDPATGSTVSFGPGTVIASGGGSGGASGVVIGTNGSSGSMGRTMKIANGQMVITTTQNGVTTTKTVPAPPSGSVISGSAPGEPDTMVIVDQNGVAHTVPVPPVGTAHAVMITTTPDGTNNVLQINPSTDSP